MKVKAARIAAINRERMILTPNRMAFLLLNRRRGRQASMGLANWMVRCQQSRGAGT
jgi:hypothetical protein